jgi:hypothetical protein
MGKPLYTAIVFFEDKTMPRKYRNISNIHSFAKFCKLTNAYYFNVYNKETKQYVNRVYLNDKTP